MVASQSSLASESPDSQPINKSRRYRDREGNWRPLPWIDNVRLDELGAPSELEFRCENDWHYFVMAAEMKSRGVDCKSDDGKAWMQKVFAAILRTLEEDDGGVSGQGR